MNLVQRQDLSPTDKTDTGDSSSRVAALVSGYFRCPEQPLRFSARSHGSTPPGYFLFGPEVICFGHCSAPLPASHPNGHLPDVSSGMVLEDGFASLPFDPGEVVTNLREERYVVDPQSGSSSLVRNLYYFVRPLLPVAVRRHLQKIRLSDWDKIPFPRWPVDCSVDQLLEQLLLIALRQSGMERIPFIWFWPEGHTSCILMSHDIETARGRDFCSALMDLDSSYGIRASFQVVPERRYTVPPEFLESIRARGFEVAIHDLNHDGHLYENRGQFLERVQKINDYGRQFGARGFRAAVLYRRQAWYDAFQFSFDMSVPNVAHLDPQRGGCCSVMPYFLGNILEIPVTATQDYTLFSILNDYSIELWKRQTAIILAKHGLMSFIVHPDYVIEPRARAVFQELLGHLGHLRDEQGAWVALPSEIDRWWRDRAAMQLVETGGRWQVQGPGSERACLAWASEKYGRLEMTLDQ